VNLRRYTIKRLLFVSASIIIASIVAFAVIFLVQQRSSDRDRELILSLEKLRQYNLMMQIAKDEFLFRDAFQNQLYRTGNSANSVKFDNLISQTLDYLTLLKDKGIEDKNLIELNRRVVDYRQSFADLKELVIVRGFKDFGLEGQLRSKIHAVERLTNQKKDYQLMSLMLMLRRHEKDYIIRRDTVYLQKFENTVQQALSYVSKNYGGEQNELAQHFMDYKKLFNEYAVIDANIGKNDNEGAIAKLNNLSIGYAQDLSEIIQVLLDRVNTNSYRSYITKLMLIIIISGIMIIFFAKISQHISSTIKSIQKTINKLGQGELPKTIKIKGKDEFSSMEESINELCEALRNTRDFAKEVGNGNFYSEVNVFGNTGELGLGLLEMRKKLMEVALEQEKNNKENALRGWLNESLANVSNLLRTDHNDTSTLCFEFLRFCIKNIEAQQGGIFVLRSDEEGNSEYLDLFVSYAFDRRKCEKKRFNKDEGLVGACLFEIDVIYLTDIPKDYVHFTTGLGVGSPNCIVLVPLITDRNEALGVIEIAAQKIISEIEVEFLKKASVNLASTIKLFRMIAENRSVINEMQMKTDELISSQEELKQNMEELTTIREDMERREFELLSKIKDLKYQLNDSDYDEIEATLQN
jgi:hypothetical protein